MDVLARIKRAIIGRHYVFTDKADVERERDGLTERDVIINTNLSGTLIYSKGALRSKAGVGTFYLLVSSKQAL